MTKSTPPPPPPHPTSPSPKSQGEPSNATPDPLAAQSVPQASGTTVGQFPVAQISPRPRPMWLRWLEYTWWLLPVLGVVCAIILTKAALPSPGEVVRVRFDQGHGIKPGDQLRYRGITVGEISAVELNGPKGGVVVVISLGEQAEVIAKEGSRFWIERPQLSLSRVSGLDTVIGAKYVGVVPGDTAAARQTEFEGLSAPPLVRDGQSLEILVRFRQGHGLAAGDVVQHRGITVGEVTAVDLSDDFSHVNVRVRLAGTARNLARVGTQFWIERPRVSVTEIRGLETLVRGRYLAVLPASATAEPAVEFEGLDIVPAIDLPEGGLEIVLEGPSRAGLEVGAPVNYRGHQVGKIVSVGLATDAATVEARAVIDPDFRGLVCTESRFWSNSGFNFQIGFTGVEFNAETLSTIAAGGVSFATHERSGEAVKTGHRFRLYEEAERDWLAWQPRIPLGGSLLPAGVPVPNPTRVTLRWKKSTLGIGFSKQRPGWLLPLDDGSVLGPADLMTPEPTANSQGSLLEAQGAEFQVDGDFAHVFGLLAVSPQRFDSNDLRAWPRKLLRAPTRPEESLLIADPQSLRIPLAVARVTTTENGWKLDPALPVNSAWHGGCAVSRVDGRVIGILLVDENGPHVAPLTEQIIQHLSTE